jgi:guanylate-binding protein 6
LLDTEGLHSSERTTDVDLKIFALTVLLSSTFVFNQMGPINESSLTDLHLISNLVKLFGAKKDDSRAADFDSFPDFYWCLRDFYHDISEDFNSPKDYMESCLKPVMGVDQDTMKKN